MKTIQTIFLILFFKLPNVFYYCQHFYANRFLGHVCYYHKNIQSRETSYRALILSLC